MDLFHHSGVEIPESRLRGCVPLDRVAAELRARGEDYATLALAVRKPHRKAARTALARSLGLGAFRTNAWTVVTGPAQLERLRPWLAFLSLWRVRLPGV